MGEEIGGKGHGAVHVAKLREMLQKVQSLALGPRAEGEEGATDRQYSAGIPPPAAAEGRRLRSLRVVCDLEEESCQSPEPPSPDVPRGYFAVYVGQEQRRFVIPTSYLALPVFRVLLEKAEEEFGFDHKGAIALPCEIETFKYILQCMERQQTKEPSTRGGMLR